MRFTRVAMNDFVSYDNQDLDISALDYVAIAGANGSGKSTIMLAVAWALFGTFRVKNDSDSVIRDGQSECSVTLEFEADGTLWRIERGKKRGKSAKVRLYSQDAQGEWLPYGDHLNRTAQDRIEELVGMSEDAFYSLTIIDGQSGARFIKADSSQRRDILLNLLPEMGHWSRMEERAREMAATCRSTVDSEQTRLAADAERVSETRTQLAENEQEYEALDPETLDSQVASVESDITALLSRFESAAQAEQTRYERAQRAHESRTSELRSEATLAKQGADSAESRLRTMVRAHADVADAKEELAEIATQVTTARATALSANTKFETAKEREPEVGALTSKAATETEAAAGLRSRLAADEKSLRGLTQMQEEHEATCPTCRTHLDTDDLNALVGRLNESIDEAHDLIEKHAADAKKASSEADALARLIADAESDADNADRKVERVEDRHSDAESAVRRSKDRLDETIEEVGVDSVDDARTDSEKAAKKATAASERHHDYEATARDDLATLSAAVESAKTEAAESSEGRMLDGLRESKRTLQGKVRQADTLSGRLAVLRKSIRDTTESMRGRQDAIKDDVERVDALDQVVTACRPQGIPSMLLDGVLAPIEVEATRILNEVPGGEGMALRFEQARALKSRVGAREVLDIVVTLPSGAERPIESLSAGESVRVSLSLVFAMISVLGARRGGDALDTVFLDEPLGPLDQEAVPAFVQVLRSAVTAGSLSSVMVVTHDQRVIDALPQRIWVERSDVGDSVATITT